MYDQLVEPFLRLLSTLFGFEAGTTEFYIVLAVTLLTLLVIARLIAGLFGSEAGICVTALAVAAPLIFAFSTYIALEAYALPKIEAEWASRFLPWSGFGFVFILILFGFSARLWDVGLFVTLWVMLLAAGAGYVGLSVTHEIIKVVNRGSERIEEHNETLEKDVEVVR